MTTMSDHEFEIKEMHARNECDGMGVVDRQGRIDHGFNQLLRECFAKNKDTGSIHWQETLRLRNQLIEGYERKKSDASA